MDHLTNLRDPHAIIGLVPWVESLATAHPQVYEIMNAVKDNEGSREAFTVRYSNALDQLRSDIGRLRDMQRELVNELADKMAPLDRELEEILHSERFPASDEHE